jgi:hypothetical protein
MGKTIFTCVYEYLGAKKKALEIFSRTSRPILIKLDAIYPQIKEIQIRSNKGRCPYQKGIISKMQLREDQG